MFNSKTHFEQVPLEVVKEIIEEQIRTEVADETIQGSDKEIQGDVLSEREGQTTARPLTLAQAESKLI